MSSLAQGHRIGAYRIVRLLGEGGMGAVYEARHESLDRRVALKTLLPDSARDEQVVARFFNEARVLSRLEHPSIVQASDFGQTPDGTAYLVMEFLRGHSLSRRLRTLAESNQRMTVVAALQLGWQVADVLALAHAQGIVHRDLKPDNLMLVADPIAPGGERAKVLDFGIAKLTGEAYRGGVKTTTEAVIGTPTYMSPEQCEGAGGVDEKTDVYSLGCVLYEVLTGRPPVVAEGMVQIIGQHMFGTPPPVASLAPKVPGAVCELVHRMLIKDKTQRPSMSEVADELGQLLSQSSGGISVVRSRLPAGSEEDPSYIAPIAQVSTTLGRSNGQNVPRLRRYLALGILGSSMLVAGVVLAVLSLHGTKKLSQPTAPSPATDSAARVAAAPPPAVVKSETQDMALAQPEDTQANRKTASVPPISSNKRNLDSANKPLKPKRGAPASTPPTKAPTASKSSSELYDVPVLHD